MKKSKPFRFKEFTVFQDRSAMKIGTDGVLLGAWCSLKHKPNAILDVGTGTGVIALQLAQRSLAETIDAVEVDENAYEQAVENFENSDWSDRLFCYHSSFEEFAKEMAEEEEEYDLIVSNPPFYSDNYTSQDLARSKARFTAFLSFENLILSAVRILASEGLFAVIIPFKEEPVFTALAQKYGLKLCRKCAVKGTPEAEIKRSLLEYGFHKENLIEEELTIELSRHQYTDEYKNLVKDFYLKI